MPDLIDSPKVAKADGFISRPIQLRTTTNLTPGLSGCQSSAFLKFRNLIISLLIAGHLTVNLAMQESFGISAITALIHNVGFVRKGRQDYNNQSHSRQA
jgi:hypothetical protein